MAGPSRTAGSDLAWRRSLEMGEMDPKGSFEIVQMDHNRAVSFDPPPADAREAILGGYRTNNPSRIILTTNQTWEPTPKGHDFTDFMALIAVISYTYSNGQYIEMANLDPLEKPQPVGIGQTYEVYSLPFEVDKQSVLNTKYMVRTQQTMILKKDILGTYANMVKEIQILGHVPIYQHPNIVTLQGIGWSYVLDEFPRYADDMRTHVEPRVILEKADETLQDLLDRCTQLSTNVKFRLLYHIALGLQAIHDCGIVHGDIKPENILMFNTLSDNETVFLGTAKIADFSHSIIDTSDILYILEGTPGYGAPETRKTRPPSRVQITDAVRHPKAVDIWSFGVLCWNVIYGGNLDSVPIEPGQPYIDLIDPDDNEEIYPSLGKRPAEFSSPDNEGQGIGKFEEAKYHRVMSHVYRDYQNSVNEQELYHLKRRIFHNTLRKDPRNRNLGRVIESLRRYLNSERPGLVDGCLPNASRILESPVRDTLYISYQAFRSVSGVVKDRIVRELEEIIKSKNDPRRPRALYELAVCSSAEFGSPNPQIFDQGFIWMASPWDINLTKDLNYLIQAAEVGEMAAKAVLYRMFNAADRKLPEELKSGRILDWLEEASSHGYATAREDLSKLNSPRYARSLQKWALRAFEGEEAYDEWVASFENRAIEPFNCSRPIVDRCLNSRGDGLMHWAVACGHVEWVSTLISDGVNVNQQNNEGYTPLVLGCQYGQFETVSYLLQEEEVHFDLSLRTKLGESALHFLWCFADDDEASHIFFKLLHQGIDFMAMATEAAQLEGTSNVYIVARRCTRFDPRPVVSGLAVERVAARNRPALVKLFLENGPKFMFNPCNGATTRRMILWAYKQWDEEMVVLLTRLFDGNFKQSVIRDSLIPLDCTRWEYEGNMLSLPEAAAAGWVSGCGDGWDVPVEYWRRCSNVTPWHKVIRFIKHCSPGFGWAVERGHTDFTALLFDMRPTEERLNLVSDAVRLGGRAMFEQVAPGLTADGKSILPTSLYSVLARSKHYDIWFAQRLLQLKSPMCDFNDSFEIPPLCIALRCQFFELSLFLGRNGEPLDGARYSNIVLPDVLQPSAISEATVRFLFKCNYLPLPPRFKERKGYHVFAEIGLQCVEHKFYREYMPTKWQEIERIWCYLLKEYPGFQDPPWSFWKQGNTVFYFANYVSLEAVDRTLATVKTRPSWWIRALLHFYPRSWSTSTELDYHIDELHQRPGERGVEIYKTLYKHGLRHSPWIAPETWILLTLVAFYLCVKSFKKFDSLYDEDDLGRRFAATPFMLGALLLGPFWVILLILLWYFQVFSLFNPWFWSYCCGMDLYNTRNLTYEIGTRDGDDDLIAV